MRKSLAKNVLAAVILAGCMLVIFAVYLRTSYANSIREITAEMALNSQKTASLLEGKYKYTSYTLQQIALHMQEKIERGESFAQEDAAAFLDDYLQVAQEIGNEDYVGFVGASGWSYAHGFDGYWEDIKEQPYIRQGLQGESSVNVLVKDDVRQTGYVVLTRPVYANGQIAGVVCILNEIAKDRSIGASILPDEVNCIMDKQGQILLSLGEEDGQLLGGSHLERLHEEENAAALQQMTQDIRQGHAGTVRIKKQGSIVEMVYYQPLNMGEHWILASAVPYYRVLTNILGGISQKIVVCLIVALLVLSGFLYYTSEQKKQSRYIERLAFYDDLTGLPNKNYFEFYGAKDLLEGADGDHFAVVVFDVVNFNLFNDLYGYAKGDQVLIGIAKTSWEMLEEGEEIFRVHNDVFGLLLRYDEQVRLTQRMCGIFAEINDHSRSTELGVGVLEFCCGIYMIEDRNMPVQMMLDLANMARKSVKVPGQNKRVAYYDSVMREQQLTEREMENEMEQALLGEDFQLYLQPKNNLATGEICGAEVLVRWMRKGEILLPSQFIPLFEKDGFIEKLDFYLFEQICKTEKRWQDAGRHKLVVSINMSRVHLNDQDFVARLAEIADRYGIERRRLEIEMTETLFLKDNLLLFKTMNKIKEAGFQLAIDDFGAGYSSLNVLKEIPADVLKLDRKFLGNLAFEEGKGKCIIKHVITMAEELNMQVVSEGVETGDQVAFLKNIGCKVAQGFYFAYPMPVGQFEAEYLGET